MSNSETAKPRANLMRDRNFARYISGGALSMLGDQFTMLALPWLVLKMTGDTLLLGLVMALIGVPRAIFILIGGAVVDRYSPKRVLMLTKHINTVLLGALALLVFTNTLTMDMVYFIALALGLSTAFSIPSGTSLMPRVVPPVHLQAANGMMLGIRQMSFFLGPLLAGALIAVFGDVQAHSLSSASGIGCAFLFDALSFAISAWTLHKTVLLPQTESEAKSQNKNVLHDVVDGLRHCWNDVMLRTCFSYWAAIMLLVAGPVQIAMPVLASRLGDSAAGFGGLVGANAAGSLLGMFLSGAIPHIRAVRFGISMLIIDFIIGILFMPMGLIGAIWQGFIIMLTIGTLSGFMQVRVYTWMQQRVPRAMLGRAMSIFMFIFMGITPVSSAITGWLLRGSSTTPIFEGCGMALVVFVILALLLSPMRRIAD